MTELSARDLATSAAARRTPPVEILRVVDSVYFLMFNGWQGELESNRWHFARRWAEVLPVTLLQPSQRAPHWQDAEPFEAIGNCEVLHIAEGGAEETYPLRGILQAAQVIEHMGERGHERPLLWCYNPRLTGLYASVPAVARVYHASENYFDFEGLPESFYLGLEATLRISDLVISVSSGVAEGIGSRLPGVEIALVTNGCDTSHYQPVGPESAAVRSARDGFERAAIFAGNINSRLDFKLIETAAEANDATAILFGGPVAELGEEDAETWQRVLDLENVVHLGRLSAHDLAAAYRSADLGFIPYRHDALLVRNGFPLKTLEMAATGLPVVSTRMDPIAGLASAISVTLDDEAFLERFSSLDRSTLSETEKLELLEVAAANDYDRKFEEVTTSIMHAIPGDHGVRTRLDDLMTLLGHEPWRTSCRRIFNRAEASPFHRAFVLVYGTVARFLPERVRHLAPSGLRKRIHRRIAA